MRKVIPLLACLACAGYGRRVLIFPEQSPSNPVVASQKPLKVAGSSSPRRSKVADTSINLSDARTALAMLLLTHNPDSAFSIPARGASSSSSGRHVFATTRHSVADRQHRLDQHIRMFFDKVKVPFGNKDATDQAKYELDARNYSMRMMRVKGNTWKKEDVAGGAVLLGDAEAIANLKGSAPKEEPELLPPFATLPQLDDDVDPWEVFEELFNEVAFREIYEYIPIRDEAGLGFNSYDAIVSVKSYKKLLPAMRIVIFQAIAPVFFKLPAERLHISLGFPSAKQCANGYKDYVGKILDTGLETKSTINPIVNVMLKVYAYEDGDPKAFTSGVFLWANRTKDPRGGERVLKELVSTVEQIAGSVANMIAAGIRFPEAGKKVFDEQKYFLKEYMYALRDESKAVKDRVYISSRNTAFTKELLGELPELDAFAKEVLRFYPPARPSQRVLDEPLKLSGGGELSAGTVVAPEPHLLHNDPAIYPNPERFNPDRWKGVNCSSATPLIPFATAFDGKLGCMEEVGEQLTFTMAKVLYSQFIRMYKELSFWVADNSTVAPGGYPLYTIDDGVRARFTPFSYYLTRQKSKFEVDGKKSKVMWWRDKDATGTKSSKSKLY